jgi:tagatose 6-phosphate kinase
VILCVTLNAALDVTYTVDGVRWHSGNRVTSVAERAGGKGTNVARVLAALGEDVVVTGFVAGSTGERIRRDLAAAGIAEELLNVPGESRRTLAVFDTTAGDATGFWEPGPRVSPAGWGEFVDHYRRLLPGTEAVVLSGSAPPGLPEDAYAQLVSVAHDADIPTVLDADGTALRLGVTTRPTIVKPNQAELTATTGYEDLLAGAEELLRRGAEAVVVSAGADGLVALTPQHRWAARPPARLAGNPTGAGDACVAALARGLITDSGWPMRLADAVALSAAAVLRPLAGEVDLDAYRRFRASIQVEEF